MQNNRRIGHLDMDAFYASIELLRYPELRGQPLVIGGSVQNSNGKYPRLRDYVGRGVVATSTYEARSLGVHSGMGLMRAAQLAPEAFLLPADFAIYEHYSALFKAAVMKIVPVIEDVGIDEIYLDLTTVNFSSADLADQLRSAVNSATGLTCSIGIAPNKLLAKMCSDLNKPNGATILKADEIQERIWPLPLRKINGIGPKSEQKLNELGVTTIGDLAAVTADTLIHHFGNSYGSWLHEAAQGHDDRPLVTHWEPKSFGREITFDIDLHPITDRQQLSAILTALCSKVAEDLSNRGYSGRSVGVKLRYADFTTITRSHSWDTPFSDTPNIRRAAGICLKGIDRSKKIRLLGVRVGRLISHSDVYELHHYQQLKLPL